MTQDNDDRRTFLGDLEARLAALEQKLEELKLQASLGKMEAKDRGRDLIATLRRRREELREKVANARSASQHAWTDTRSGLTKAWEALEQSFRDAAGRFR